MGRGQQAASANLSCRAASRAHSFILVRLSAANAGPHDMVSYSYPVSLAALCTQLPRHRFLPLGTLSCGTPWLRAAHSTIRTPSHGAMLLGCCLLLGASASVVVHFFSGPQACT